MELGQAIAIAGSAIGAGIAVISGIGSGIGQGYFPVILFCIRNRFTGRPEFFSGLLSMKRQPEQSYQKGQASYPDSILSIHIKFFQIVHIFHFLNIL